MRKRAAIEPRPDVASRVRPAARNGTVHPVACHAPRMAGARMRRHAAILLCLLLHLSGCTTSGRAPIESKPSAAAAPAVTSTRHDRIRHSSAQATPAFHRVVKGDTLHGIAWRYRLDYRDLVRWNKLRNPDLIIPGQQLRLTAPASAGAPPARALAPAKATQSVAARPPTARPAPAASLGWVWPATGKVTRSESVSGARGVEIRGQRGQAVQAAASGSVVYSGSGLRGYGELIIIKHNETFLSAYAHNEARLVEEGARVQTGQTIARMGDTDSREVMLHFEIRRDGKTVDPLQYLPKR